MGCPLHTVSADCATLRSILPSLSLSLRGSDNMRVTCRHPLWHVGSSEWRTSAERRGLQWRWPECCEMDRMQLRAGHLLTGTTWAVGHFRLTPARGHVAEAGNRNLPCNLHMTNKERKPALTALVIPHFSRAGRATIGTAYVPLSPWVSMRA